jgi:drug/metabolite transporter (DMT)-like permease
VGSGTGTGFLYRGFASGRMSVVAPVSAVGAAVVPVFAGGVTGERPSAVVWVGVAAALPGICLVSTSPPPADGPDGINRGTGLAEGLTDGVLAGLGFGLLFACLGQVSGAAGLWPLATCQAMSVVSVMALARALRAVWRPRHGPVVLAALPGVLGATATGLFLAATHHGYLTVAGVLASLYPAGTVLLAALVLRERVHRTQGVGLLLCAVAVALVATG